jgi:hypothetical protein
LGVAVFLLDAATFFARFTVFFLSTGIPSGSGSFCCGFPRVTILVNITGAGVDIFSSRNQGNRIEIFGLIKPNVKENGYSA